MKMRDKLKDWQIIALFWMARRLTMAASWCADWAEREIELEMKRTADIIKECMKQAEIEERKSHLH